MIISYSSVILFKKTLSAFLIVQNLPEFSFA